MIPYSIVMTADEVRALVRDGVAELRAGSNLHGTSRADVGLSLVDPPRRIPIKDANGSEFGAWIVADEHPESPTSGYLVVFDEESVAFGLCVKGRAGSAPTLIGIYGSFATTMQGM